MTKRNLERKFMSAEHSLESLNRYLQNGGTSVVTIFDLISTLKREMWDIKQEIKRMEG